MIGRYKPYATSAQLYSEGKTQHRGQIMSKQNYFVHLHKQISYSLPTATRS